MVGKILTHGAQVVRDLYSRRLQRRTPADARQLEEVGGAINASGQDDFARIVCGFLALFIA